MRGWIFSFLCLASFLQAEYKHVIFDLGQVMVEWNPARMIEDTFANEERIPYELAQIFSSQLWYDYDAGLVSREELIERLPPAYDKELFARLERNIPQLVPLIPEMEEIVSSVKAQGCSVYILSNMPKAVFEGLDARHGLTQLFDGKIVSGYIGSIKPSPQIYRALLSAYSLEPQHCLFIDDREENIQGAAQCGIDGILFQGPALLRDRLEELKEK